jgi:hypothetical protein
MIILAATLEIIALVIFISLVLLGLSCGLLTWLWNTLIKWLKICFGL